MAMEFMGETCTVVRAQYPNGRTALRLVSVTGEPLAMATVNIPEVELDADLVIIKDHSENAGMVDALVAGGIVSEPVSLVEAPFVTYPVCRLKEVVS